MSNVKNSEAYIGLDIGGTKCAAVIGSLTEEIRIDDKISFPTAGKAPDEILSHFARFVEEKQRNRPIAGIGIACGGPLDSKRGVILKPPSLPLWDGIEAVRYFEERFGVKTLLLNDADACAVAEWRYGAGKGCDNMIFLTFGTGLGAGLILNGKLYSGTNDNAGEIGHVRLTSSGPLGYGKTGSCEGYCSGGGLRRLALLELDKLSRRGKMPDFLKNVGGRDAITAKSLAESARAGDPFALAIFKKSGEMFGRTLSILIDLFNPQRIVAGGVFMRSGDLLTPHAERILKKECLSFSRAVCEIRPAMLKENIGDVSALVVAKGDYR